MHRQAQSVRHEPHRSGEAGYILLAVLFLVALILIALAVAAPRIAASIQRDKEEELIHRGLQYRQAIKLYYKKFGRYPASIDQLENTNNIRFLRKHYVDPITGKDDWKLVRFGQAHVKPMGLFGQPISNAGTAGSSVLGGSAGQGTQTGAPPTGSAFGSSGALQSTSGSTFGSSSNSGSSDSGSSGTSGSGSTSSSGFGSSSSSSGFGSSNSNNTNQTFGGAPMVGVASKSEKASLKIYKQQTHYNEWEFVYDPLEDLQAGSLFGGAANVNGTNGTGSNSTTTPGTSSPSSSFGSSPGTSTPPVPTPPSSPQQ